MSADRDEAHAGWDEFARQHFQLLVAVMLRVVGNPATAFDLAVETLATLRRRWSESPAGDEQRDAPPPQQLRALRRSPLVHAEPLPDQGSKIDGA